MCVSYYGAAGSRWGMLTSRVTQVGRAYWTQEPECRKASSAILEDIHRVRFFRHRMTSGMSHVRAWTAVTRCATGLLSSNLADGVPNHRLEPGAERQ